MTRILAVLFAAIGGKIFLQPGTTLSIIVICLVSIKSFAQDESAACPCFNVEEVEAIIQRADQLAEGEGASTCTAQDYSVELKAEITIWDNDFSVIAQASVEWFDFDPGHCAYTDSVGSPGIERNVRWPHPAPETTARACYDIMTSVIAKSDTTGKCISM